MNYYVNRNRIRQYPAFVNCTTIDWFSEWPYEALIEVADKYLESIEMANAEEVSAYSFPYEDKIIILYLKLLPIVMRVWIWYETVSASM